MALKKGFLDKKVDLFQLSKLKLIIGLLLFVSISFFFYYFFLYLREFLRIINASLNHNNLVIFTSEKQFFYNFFFAFISVIFAQSIIFSFWFNNNRTVYQDTINIKLRFVHESKYFVWFFIEWFGKLGIIFGLLNFDFIEIDLYNDYKYLFYLIGMVLFLQTWKTLRLFFRNNVLKWMFLSLITLLTTSYLLTKISQNNFKKIEQIILSENLYYKNEIHIPNFIHHSLPYEEYRFINLYLNKQDSIFFTFDDNLVAYKYFNNSHKVINKNRFLFDDESTYNRFLIHADKNIKMQYINKLKESLREMNLNRIGYVIRPEQEKNVKPYYFISYDYIKFLIPEKNASIPENDKSIHIKLTSDLKIFINEEIYDQNNFDKKLKQLIELNPEFPIVYEYDNQTEYFEYLKIINSIKNVFFEMNWEDAKMKLGPEMNEINFIIDYDMKYQMNIFEKYK